MKVFIKFIKIIGIGGAGLLILILVTAEVWRDYIPMTKRQLYAREKFCKSKGCLKPETSYFIDRNCINYCYDLERGK